MARAKRPAATSSSMMPVPAGRRSSWRMGGGLRMSKRRKSRRAGMGWGPAGGGGGRLEDVEEAEEQEGEYGVRPVGRAEDEGDELAGNLVDDDVAGVFAAGL